MWLSDGDPFDFIVQTLETLDFSLTLMLVDNSIFNFYRENSFAIEFRVFSVGCVSGWLGGPFDFIVSQSPFLLGFGMERFDL